MKKTLVKGAQRVLVLSSIFVAQPAFAATQEGTSEPGQGLSAVETALYFFVAPFGLFLTIVLVGYAVHRPRHERVKTTNALTEIR